MKSLLLSTAGLGLLGLGVTSASANDVDLPVGWRDPGSSVGNTFGLDVGVDDRWQPPAGVSLDPFAVPNKASSALAVSIAIDDDKECTTSETVNACSTANVKKCSTSQSNLDCSTFSFPETCSTTAMAGTQCTAFSTGECSTEDNVCSAKGEGWCSADGGSQAKCSAKGSGFCSVKEGEGGSCTSMNGGKCSTDMGGANCSSWNDAGDMVDDGDAGTCNG